MKIIEINGKSHVLKLGINAMCMFEEITSNSITEIGESASISDYRAMFHCALIGGGHKHSVHETGDLMTDYIEQEGMDGLASVLGEVVTKAMGKQKDKVELEAVTK